ncbi:MAG TPA: dihydrodipicolinate reductase [Desulfatirhabdiaceae bacterium]|nr:dihydrodipicolinate reductase [Desulfatirhabdiaceae bacterium]
MNPIKIMVNGMPGNMAMNVGKHVLADSRFSLVHYSLTGPEILQPSCQIESCSVTLLRPENRNEAVDQIRRDNGQLIIIDYTHPSAVNANAEFYCSHGFYFVMGTTGGDRNFLEQRVRVSNISAVIAPNMAKQIVGFQAMMAYAADQFPDLFKGYTLTVQESHQKVKADTSGTARAMIGYFNRMGVPFKESDMMMVRDPEVQKNELNIPEAYLSGHGWHTYTLTSADQTVQLQFVHNVNGRDIYVEGTLDAVVFLAEKAAAGSRGEVFNMMDVLSNR